VTARLAWWLSREQLAIIMLVLAAVLLLREIEHLRGEVKAERAWAVRQIAVCDSFWSVKMGEADRYWADALREAR